MILLPSLNLPDTHDKQPLTHAAKGPKASSHHFTPPELCGKAELNSAVI